MDSKSGIKRGGNIHEHSEKENFALWDAFRNRVVFILSCSRRAAGEGIFQIQLQSVQMEKHFI